MAGTSRPAGAGMSFVSRRRSIMSVHTMIQADFWCLVNPDGVRWQEWGAGYSFYHGFTGETHLLSALPAELLLRLYSGPLTTAALVEITADACGVGMSAGWQQKLASILAELEALELVERVGCSSA